MGNQLTKIYEYIKKNATMPQRMEITQLSGISSDDAEKGEDTPEKVAKLTQAVIEVLGTTPQ